MLGLLACGGLSADPLQSSTLTLIDSQLNNSWWGASNLLDGSKSTRWLSSKLTNDLNFQLTTGNDDVCLSGFNLTNYGGSDRSVKQFMLLTTSNLALNADAGTAGWTPVVADANPSGMLDHISWAQGGRFVSIDGQLNTTSWAASNINDGSTNSRWLSSKSNNILTFDFDSDWNGVTGNSVTIAEIEAVNYGNNDRSVKEFQIEVTTDGANWHKLKVPATGAGAADFVFSRSLQGGVMGAIDSQLNTSSWAAANMTDGDQNTRWLSRKGNNTIEFTFDPNDSGVTGAQGDTADFFSIKTLKIANYGNDDRSVNEFQVAVKTQSNSQWQKLNVPGAAIGQEDYNFASSHQGGALVAIDAQLNSTSWGADNLHDGDDTTRWLSNKGNNTLDFQFDADENGTKAEVADRFTLKRIYLKNYGVDDRSIKEFQIEVKTTAQPQWQALIAPGASVGQPDFNFAQAHLGGSLVSIDSQLNSTSWAGANIHDGDDNTLWLSSKGNNVLDFQFDADGDGAKGGAGDLFTIEYFYLRNYGTNDRSIKQFQLEVKTTGNSNWTKLPVSGSVAGQGGYNFALAWHGGTLTSIDSQLNTTSWGADNLHDGDQNTRWLSNKQTNTLTFAFDTNNDGSTGNGVNLDTIGLRNYGTDDRSVATFEIDIQVSGGGWQSVAAPGGGSVFNANMSSTEQSWAVGPYSNVTATRMRTLSNHGDPSYTGARELVFSGNSVGPSYTFIASMNSTGETFNIDVAQQPQNVTDVRLRTINNHGDLYAVGAREFGIFGPSVTLSDVFEAAMHSNGETFTLDEAAQPENVTDIRLITIKNHGDPSYIGAREIKFLGPSITKNKTFTAAMHGNGETFILDSADIPVDVTDVKLITINNHGDPSYTGIREFEILGDSVGPSHTFTLAMSTSVQTIALDSADVVSGVVGARLVTINNHGDPSYIGMAEFGLKGTATTPNYIFEAQKNASVQNFTFDGSGTKVLRFHSLNNHGNPYSIGANEFTATSGACGGASAVHHIEVTHLGNALTCSPVALTVKACADVGCTITSAVDIDVMLSTTGGASSWSQNPVTIPGGSTNGISVSLSHTSAETVTLGATSTPAADSGIVCDPNCNIDFQSSGYLVTLANHQSCGNTDLVIKAVKLSDTGVSCAPAYIGNQSVDFAFNYLNPLTGTKLPTLASTTMAPATVSQTRTVNFDSTGSATLAFNYADAGQIRIDVSDAGSAGLASSSVTAIATPAQLLFASTDISAQCVSGDVTCSVFKAAGAPFNLAVMAACADNTITPNFALDNIALSVNTVAPSLGNPVTLGVTSVNILAGDNGVNTITNQTVSEVGVFTVTATPTVNGYLGTTVPESTSGHIGRFTPGNFILSTTLEGSLSGGNPFVYTGQMSDVVPANGKIGYTLVPKFTATAKSLAGDTTLNYTGTFATMQAQGIVRVVPTEDATQLGADGINNVNLVANLGTPTLTPLNGVVTYEFAVTDHFVYIKEANAVVEAFTSDIDLQITSVTDADGIAANDTDADVNNGVLTLGPSGVELRFGRWVIGNSYGSEAANLSMPMSLQYFDGIKFVTNTSDNFTTFDADNDGAITDIDLAPAVTSATGNGTFISGATMSAQLLAPGTGSRGGVKFGFTVPDWLMYDWLNVDGQSDGPYDENPFAMATFGVFRGNDRVIYWREKK
ncbi:MAG: discoidin domain-containing protein [Algicola sp.]|nr:discoidin domain-containing protein [Algicola sp.]